MIVTAEGSAVERQGLLRLHHGQQVTEPLHGNYEQYLSPCAREHKCGDIEGFTKRYKIDRLVYYETFGHVGNAIAREKQIKSWTRAKRLALIKSKNPTWQDLAEGWGGKIELQIPRRAG